MNKLFTLSTSDSYGAQRLRTSTSPKSELLAAALVPSGTLRERYRPPISPKVIPTERFAIALHIPKQRSPSVKFSNAL
ncbi:MAG: hypothetical protein HEQ20_15930 [Aphanizomenon flos-aquae KM1D3_PB]|uniref:hypothetical protein n=1 Tax=Aphanizomenon flos-aquae TaxID=1176 RepID=UPI000A742930|nr:hypothetical protein [Aphanizomenon flos-aquae]QSV71965.1 MAG: hypothetical protein HEQ20_15930 [Aphanizomenon flos-aquae KM1D3_PB]